jgi:hypothetical protein
MNDIQIFAFIIVPLVGLVMGWGLAFWALCQSRRRLPGE